MTYTIVICYPCPATRQQRAQSSSIWSMFPIDVFPNFNHTEGVVRRARGRARAFEATSDSKTLISSLNMTYS